MSEGEPYIRLNVGGEDVEFEPRNTSLYRHIAEHAIYDHLFRLNDELTDGEQTGNMYFIRPYLDEDTIDEMTEFAVNNNYYSILNIRTPAKCDVEAYDRHIAERAEQLPDTFPEGWL